jgi:hypothetical protein
MASSFTTNKNLELPANGDYVDTWNIPVNGDMSVIDQAFGGVTSLNATSGSATLSYTQYRSLMISISGAISADVAYTIPSGVGGQWIVRNTTTDATGGPWVVRILSGGSGTSVVLARNVNLLVFSDGTNIRSINLVAPGSTTQLIFNNGGAFDASSGMTWDGTTLTANAISSATSIQASTILSAVDSVTAGTTVTAGTAVIAGTTVTAGTTIAAGTTASDGIGNLREVPPNSKTGAYVLLATDSGKYISITAGGVTVPSGVFSAGQTISIYNNSTSNQTVTQGSGITMILAASNTTGNRTLSQYGLCTILCTGTNTFVITGAGLT